METKIIVDRVTANQLNPLISYFCAKDTLQGIAELINESGSLLSTEEKELNFGRLHLVCGAIAAALAYEAHHIHPIENAQRGTK